MKIDSSLLDSLTEQAKASPRLRMNYDLRTCARGAVDASGVPFPADSSQRMLNALEPGTEVPIHRHPKSTEVVVMLRGRGVQYYYDDAGEVTDSVLLEAPDRVSDASLSCPMMSVEAGVWHRLVALESGTVIFESKDGAYEPIRPEDILK